MKNLVFHTTRTGYRAEIGELDMRENCRLACRNCGRSLGGDFLVSFENYDELFCKEECAYEHHFARGGGCCGG